MKHRELLIYLIFSLFTIQVYGQSEKFKALYIYQFTKYIEWPSTSGNKFQIAVYGDAALMDELKIISSKKKIGDADIVIRKVNSVEEIGDVQICYISSSMRKNLAGIAAVLKNKNVLIITNEAMGSFGINFIESNQKLNFQVSKSNIESHGLKINTQLLALGIPVN